MDPSPFILTNNPPLPEPPRVIPSRPWIQDNSFKSRQQNGSLDHKAKITTTIHPSKDLLKRLRLKYGIVTNDYGEQPTDYNNSLIENIQLINSCPTSISEDKQYKSLQNKLYSIQNNIRTQLAKLQSPENETGHITCSCHNFNYTPQLDKIPISNSISNIPKQLFHCIKRQDEQLQIINKKINQLLKFHQEIDQLWDKNRKNEYSSLKISQNSNSLRNYLDSSIEKVRNDLRQSVESFCLYQNEETHVKQIYSHKKSNHNSYKSPSRLIQDEDIFYSNILSEVNPILNCDGDDADDNTDGSSCSITSDKVITQNPQVNYTPSNKPCKKCNYNTGKLLHTKESIYIQQLASKYHLDGSNQQESLDEQQSNIILESIRMTSSNQFTGVTKSKSNGHYENFPISFNRYALSEQNSSIATRNYLNKYGLIINMDQENFYPDSPTYRHRSLIGGKDWDVEHSVTAWKNRNHHKPLQIIKALNEKKTNYKNVECKRLLQNSNQKTGRPIKEIKSRPLDRLIDLDLLQRLPKLE